MTEVPHGHRIPLAGTEGWTVWRTVFVRGAGFAADRVLRLSAPATSRAADELLDAEGILEREAERARVRLADRMQSATDEEQRSLRRALTWLRDGRVPSKAPAELDEVRRARSGLEDARARLSSAFEADGAHTRAAIREIARDPRFQEAVLWQNRSGFELGIEVLLRKPEDASDDKTRQKERLVASYLQRYCLKNDTIGFFGPVGWGSLSESGPALEARPGPLLLANRSVSFEHWAIDALGERFTADPQLRAGLAPRLVPSLRLQGEHLLDPERGTSTPLSALEARLIGALTAGRPAAELARALAADPNTGLLDEAQVYRELEGLVERRWVIWRLEVPALKTQPDRSMRELLSRIEPAERRARASEMLAELEAARDAVSRAAGEPSRLHLALRELDSTFERLAGRAATRHGGKVYAGRTVVYEDCRRDLDLRIGPPLLGRLGPALGVILQSARWYTHTIATRLREVFRDIYRSLGGDAGRGVEFLAFESKVFEHLPLPGGEQRRTAPPIVKEVSDELVARWTRVLGLVPGSGPVERSVREIAGRASEAFAAPCPGWTTARFHSPDLMLSARSVADVERGRYVLVLGELHTGVNTVLSNLALDQHPDPAMLVRDREADVAPSPLPVPPRRSMGVRALTLSPSPLDYDIEFDDSRSWRDRSRVLAGAELVVKDQGGRLRVQTLDGRADFDVVEAFQTLVMGRSAPFFQLAPSWKHRPRILLDGLVIARESWTFEPDEYSFVRFENRMERFVGARRWARAHGLPRFVFVATPEELKPWYLDLDSPIYLELFAWAARRASRVRVSEMLPGIGETWLPDAEGRTYTSELRMVAVDPVPWSAP